jgi:16S rRNA (adenine1518-N6/adenine1519-N6)-dimethyltransferase
LYDVVNSPKKMLILMQRDVALRILWKKSSVLSLFVQKKCVVKEVLFVWKENFVPSPKVESSVLLFEIHNLYQNIDDKQFLEFIKKWFKEPRKKLLKNLINAWYAKDDLLKIFQKFSLDENVRGEDLWIEIWCELFGECRRREER